jgi:hypothetical protein
MFSGRKKLLGVVGAGLLVATIGAGGAALAQGGGTPVPGTGDDEGNSGAITGDALAKASDAALAHTGGGTVSDTEQGDEESFYEVEVTLADGSQVDVQLDQNFNVVGDKAAEVGEDAGPGEHGDNDADTEDGAADSETPDDSPSGAPAPAN